MGKGIDYGMGTTNIDRETGIRYGVINSHAMGDYYQESFEADFGDPYCPECVSPVTDDIPDDAPDQDGEYYCRECKAYYESDHVYPEDPIGHYCTEPGYTAEEHSDGDIFVTKSPYFTFAQFCSPCAPGAGHLENPDPEGVKTYCFGHDWFKGNVAPYPVYDVKTGELVPPPNN